jgi:hypothetical protein
MISTYACSGTKDQEKDTNPPPNCQEDNLAAPFWEKGAGNGRFYKVDCNGKTGFIDKDDVVVGEIDSVCFKTDSVLPKNLPEDNYIFYYHPDHLGSTGYMTDRWGRIAEHLQYTPWGETWVEQRRGSDVLPMYQFTGKELDPETNVITLRNTYGILVGYP